MCTVRRRLLKANEVRVYVFLGRASNRKCLGGGAPATERPVIVLATPPATV